MDAEIMVTKTETTSARSGLCLEPARNLAAPVHHPFSPRSPPRRKHCCFGMFADPLLLVKEERADLVSELRECVAALRKSRSCVFCTEWPFA